jgi:two-component system, OmpR family, copper resistance phosphate regulon response regulator CusR
MLMPRVLVVEDERKVRQSLQAVLEQEGYEVAAAADGAAGLRLALAQRFDCIVLDLMLPGRDGLQVLAELRRTKTLTPVLILTARDAVEDRVLGLDVGADDYLVKPFAFAELLARLRVLQRRGEAEQRATMLRVDDLQMDLVARRVTRGGSEVALTQREFEVLEYLLRHKNEVVTREMLGRDVWHEPDHALTKVVEVYITLVRRKVDKLDAPSLIHTIRGVGYCLGERSCP